MSVFRSFESSFIFRPRNHFRSVLAVFNFVRRLFYPPQTPSSPFSLLAFPLKRVKHTKKKTVSRFRQSRSSATVWIFRFAPPYNITSRLDDDDTYNDLKITVWSISNCRNACVFWFFFLRRFAHLVKRSRQYLLLHQRFVRRIVIAPNNDPRRKPEKINK